MKVRCYLQLWEDGCDVGGGICVPMNEELTNVQKISGLGRTLFGGRLWVGGTSSFLRLRYHAINTHPWRPVGRIYDNGVSLSASSSLAANRQNMSCAQEGRTAFSRP